MTTPPPTRGPQGAAFDQRLVLVHAETVESQLGEGGDCLGVAQSPVDTLLCISEKDQQDSSLPPPQLCPMADPRGQIRTFRPTKHITTVKKMMEWGLSVRKEWCILGDSNLGRIPDFHLEHLQIDSYPGATFRHAEAFISKASIQAVVKGVILSFGINNRGQKNKETAFKELQRVTKIAKERFPGAAIYIPLINFSKSLKLSEQSILSDLNAYITRNCQYLPLLPEAQFQVGDDLIHWTPTCARAILQHWCNYLNW